MTDVERYEFERRAKLHEIAIKGVITPGWCKIAVYPPKLNMIYACDGCKVIRTTTKDNQVPIDEQFGGRNLKEYEFL